ncbi:hypothetical protein A5647_07995 [Mycobacterium sp. 1100029.7]|nr:hypothetical protein A5647_07995 [Mycobacterium sp. 1100029.7]
MTQTAGGAPERAAFSRFATGVTIVTYQHDPKPRGLTENSFTSGSMDPALALVSIAKRSAAAERAGDAPRDVAGQDIGERPWATTTVSHTYPSRLEEATT